MLECKTYTYQEFRELFSTRDSRSMKNRLSRWGVDFQTTGRGQNIQFHIQRIKDPFKVYCILDLGYSPQVDFDKLALLLYYFLNDDSFPGLPMETMELRMRENGHTLTRQTIKHYLGRLEKLEMISTFAGDYRYYFARRGVLRDATKEEYSKAWQEYWKDQTEGSDSGSAIARMCARHGGVARKQRIIEFNVFFNDAFETLNNYVLGKVEEKLLDEKGQTTYPHFEDNTEEIIVEN